MERDGSSVERTFEFNERTTRVRAGRPPRLDGPKRRAPEFGARVLSWNEEQLADGLASGLSFR
jgi:hypothetical protein